MSRMINRRLSEGGLEMEHALLRSSLDMIPQRNNKRLLTSVTCIPKDFCIEIHSLRVRGGIF